ncbi:MAG: formamidopyrimidine-DNA glycosylase [Acidimicrobiales bacterium]|nr:formamidopyrimidine-DNA glycosylase [Acidimicrobiales bacterium]
MPELLEVEYYRRLAERTVGRRIASVDAPDAWYLQQGLDAAQLEAVLAGAVVAGTRRRGKLLVLDLDGAPPLGLRFGMTGRLVVDGEAAIERLEYASARHEPGWERFRVRFEDGGSLVMVDPRRLGGVSLDPDVAQLGPEATTLTPSGLRRVLERSQAPLKARLLDQARLAGLGNLLADEILWRARLAPTRAAGGLDESELRRLHRVLRSTLRELDGRGGSHTGDLFVARRNGGLCPRCENGLARDQVGGRTTYWCPAEQR